ncbi:hypothetical protein GCM10023219_24590 [Stakelama sediminis]
MFVALLGVGGMVLAQSDSPSGNAGSFEVDGIPIDVTAKTDVDARQDGWKLAQRKGWEILSRRITGHSSRLPDSTLDDIVSGIVIEHEEVGDKRYVATLGVQFDRARAGSILGVATQIARSSPMLLLPLQWSGGVGTSLERDTPWNAAWRRFRTGDSRIDYIRVAGNGPDALLLNAGQVGRRDRNWWRSILNQYGADDVLIPQVRLERQWPGGPIIATFIAGHGPDNDEIARFRLRVDSASGLGALLDEGVKRLDAAYEKALSDGTLHVDHLLTINPQPVPTPTPTSTPTPLPGEQPAAGQPGSTSTSDVAAAPTIAVSIQFPTPSAGAVTETEQAIRGVAGVRSAITNSLALGGVSVMQVHYAGTISELASSLKARGWQVTMGNNSLRISRNGG